MSKYTQVTLSRAALKSLDIEHKLVKINTRTRADGSVYCRVQGFFNEADVNNVNQILQGSGFKAETSANGGISARMQSLSIVPE